MNTLVVQSQRSPLPYSWVESCLDSVRNWCALNRYEYHFMADDLFDVLPSGLADGVLQNRVVASDLARLLVLQDALRQGYKTVVWLDADFLIFNADKFILPDGPYALGREVWVQSGKRDKIKVYKKVHNALLVFRRANGFLDFYIETATRLLMLNNGTIAPQFIGPKLLTALHNIALLPVMECAGMLSPLVIKDIIQGGGPALELFVAHSPQAITGANLCISSCDRGELKAMEMQALIASLIKGEVGLS